MSYRYREEKAPLTGSTNWKTTFASPLLRGNDVHVWCAALNLPPAHLGALYGILSDEERGRITQFRFCTDQERFIARRGILRIILSCYLGGGPARLRFSSNPYGKPTLSSSLSRAIPFHFNVSHSRGLALYAVTKDAEIGVDIEWIRPEIEADEIAAHFFSPCEIAALRTLDGQQKVEAFFSCWTRKEAYLKARGVGLQRPLPSVTVSLLPGEPAAVLQTEEEGIHPRRWRLHDLHPGPGYKAALSVEGTFHQLHCWEWPKDRVYV